MPLAASLKADRTSAEWSGLLCRNSRRNFHMPSGQSPHLTQSSTSSQSPDTGSYIWPASTWLNRKGNASGFARKTGCQLTPSVVDSQKPAVVSLNRIHRLIVRVAERQPSCPGTSDPNASPGQQPSPSNTRVRRAGDRIAIIPTHQSIVPSVQLHFICRVCKRMSTTLVDTATPPDAPAEEAASVPSINVQCSHCRSRAILRAFPPP